MDVILQHLQFGKDGWGDELFYGTLLTVGLALATLPFGLALGFLAALAKNAKQSVLRAIGNLFTTIFRGLPELLTLFIVYYGGQLAINALVEAMGLDIYIEISAFLAGMVALGFVFASYASEVFLSAIRAVPAGQSEAAHAMGLSGFQTIRLVTGPQIIRHALPGLSNLWLVLLKDTSLVSVIALSDLMRQTEVAVTSTREPFFFYAVACTIYLLLSIISGVVTEAIERRAERAYQR